MSATTAPLWPVQDAKARFSEMLRASLRDGPQVVTFRGQQAAVLVPMAEWQRLQQQARPSLKALLLDAAGPRALPIPPRSKVRRGPAIEL